ncbi:MAG: hypothetical protein K8I82_00930, partial [Anaerolineae bacterium]|nr:hypothetical protein [Anaerolineae bacterium]
MRTGSLPLTAVGTALIILALVAGPWPPGGVNSRPGYTVSHQERLLGKEPASNELLFRVFDGLAYVALAQIILAMFALLFWRRRFFLLLIMAASAYGAVYSVSLGLFVGPQIAFVGFSLIFFAAVISWITT